MRLRYARDGQIQLTVTQHISEVVRGAPLKHIDLDLRVHFAEFAKHLRQQEGVNTWNGTYGNGLRPSSRHLEDFAATTLYCFQCLLGPGQQALASLGQSESASNAPEQSCAQRGLEFP